MANRENPDQTAFSESDLGLLCQKQSDLGLHSVYLGLFGR